GIEGRNSLRLRRLVPSRGFRVLLPALYKQAVATNPGKAKVTANGEHPHFTHLPAQNRILLKPVSDALRPPCEATKALARELSSPVRGLGRFAQPVSNNS